MEMQKKGQNWRSDRGWDNRRGGDGGRDRGRGTGTGTVTRETAPAASTAPCSTATGQRTGEVDGALVIFSGLLLGLLADLGPAD